MPRRPIRTVSVAARLSLLAGRSAAPQRAQPAGRARLDPFKKGPSACMEGKGHTAR